MNPLQLVLKQMRQRALSTWLTLLSVIFGAALVVSVLILRRESSALLARADFGYDILVGAKGSPTQLVLNTAYHINKSPGNIPYTVYEALRNRPDLVERAVPYIVGDTYKGHRVVGTTPAMFGFDDLGPKPAAGDGLMGSAAPKPAGPPPPAPPLAGYDAAGRLLPGYQSPNVPEDERDAAKKVAARTFEVQREKKFTFAQGTCFHPQAFQAVIGSEVASRTGLKMGDKFKIAHDAPASGASALDEHDEQWTVVGILEPTRTPEDKVVFVPLVSYYAIPQHEQAMDLITGMMKGEDLSRFGKNRPVSEGLGAPATGPATTRATTAPAAGKHDHDHGHDHKGHDHKGHRHAKDPDPYDEDVPKTPSTHPAKGPAATRATTGPATAPAAKNDHKHDHAGHDHKHDHKGHRHAKDPDPYDLEPKAAGAKTDDHAGHGHDHAGHAHEEQYRLRADGTINLTLPKDRWLLSAVLVQTKGARVSPQSNRLLQYVFSNSPVAAAVNPAEVMREIYTTFLSPTTLVLGVIAAMVALVAAVSILVSIYNSVTARGREIAVMRALGATRGRVLMLICLEAGLIGLIGSAIGMVIGHAVGAAESAFFVRQLGVGIDWLTPKGEEWLYLSGIVVLSVLAGLIPGLKAYGTPVATNLVSA